MRRATGAVREGEGIYARKLATRPVFAVFFRPWWRSPGNSSLRFSLNSADGRRVLALRPHLLWELVAVERLELEVPSQAGDPSPTEEAAAAPGTAAAEAQLARWQTRRCPALAFAALDRCGAAGTLARYAAARGAWHRRSVAAHRRRAGGDRAHGRVGEHEAFMTIPRPAGGRSAGSRCWSTFRRGALLRSSRRAAAAGGHDAARGRARATRRGGRAGPRRWWGSRGYAWRPSGGPCGTRCRRAAGGCRRIGMRASEAVRLVEGRIEMDFGGGAGARPVAAASLSVPPGDELLAHNELEPALLAYRRRAGHDRGERGAAGAHPRAPHGLGGDVGRGVADGARDDAQPGAAPQGGRRASCWPSSRRSKGISGVRQGSMPSWPNDAESADEPEDARCRGLARGRAPPVPRDAAVAHAGHGVPRAGGGAAGCTRERRACSRTGTRPRTAGTIWRSSNAAG